VTALLHLVGFAPEGRDRLDALARACSAGDILVLVDDGQGFAEPERLTELTARLPDCRIRVLRESGDRNPVPAPAEAIDHAGLVELTERHRGPASWY
jgi:sulfur transfer complex TusBCD TusB component (DsrH family)